MTLYEKINSIKDINELTKKKSSSDGEGLDFELKGSYGNEKFTKDIKSLLDKEISAFANTYGGVLCFHFGGDTNLEPFPKQILNKNFNSIEGWLRDCLEPRSLGIDLKIVDGLYIINIPESKNKPHRAKSSSHYFYRHSTISQKMPEIMISSMYRSQDYLNYIPVLGIGNKHTNQFSVNVFLKNYSNISGSKPKILVELFSNYQKQIKLENNPYVDKLSRDFFVTPKLIHDLDIPSIGRFSTNSEFANLILYSKDSILLSIFSTPDKEIKSLKYILVKVDCMLKESIRKTEYQIAEYGNDGKPKIVMSSNDYPKSKIFIKFKELIK